MAGGRCRPGDEECGQRKRREQRKRYLDGTGPIAAIMVFVIDKIYEFIKIIWNIFVDMTTDIVTWIYDVIFSDFKGVLGSNGEGYCFDLFMTRTFGSIFSKQIQHFSLETSSENSSVNISEAVSTTGSIVNSFGSV